MDAKAFCAPLATVLAMVLGVVLGPVGTAEAARPSEKQLRALETRMLGPDHAAEHARARAGARRGRRVRHTHARTGTGARRARGGVRARKADASTEGLWRAPVNIPGVAISAAMLPTNKIMYFDDVRSMVRPDDPENTARAHIYDLEHPERQPREVNPPPDSQGRPINVWCSGISYLPDGRLLVTGGNLGYNSQSGGYLGLPTVLTFDPFTEKWTRHENMRHGRWYPGQTMLPDGRTIILSGEDENGVKNREIEMFDPRTNDVSWVYTRQEDGSTDNSVMPMGAWYPRTFVMPSGRALMAGPNPVDSLFFWMEGSKFRWSPAQQGRYRTYGGVVLLPGGPSGSTRVLATGGYRDKDIGVDATTQVLDERTERWSTASDMNVARGHHNVVTLPDGSLVSIGGGLGKVGADSYAFSPTVDQRSAELYKDGNWTLGPSQTEYRTYHSTAALLPDGRVLSGGDDRADHKETDTFEIYEPAYLHKSGGRPVIQSAPSTVDYGESLSVATSGPVKRAVLMAPAATTHGFDSNQRHVELRVTPRAGGVDAVAPPNANVAPPGYYMLFVLDEAGVPSVAKWVKVGNWTGATSAYETPASAPATPATPVAPTTPRRSASPTVGAGVRIARPGRLQTALRTGLRVTVTCPERCSATSSLRLDARTARRLRRPAVVGMARASLRRAGAARFVLRPDAAVRRPLGRLRQVAVTVDTTVRVDGGASRRIKRTLLLKR
jgi:hypothetical protein